MLIIFLFYFIVFSLLQIFSSKIYYVDDHQKSKIRSPDIPGSPRYSIKCYMRNGPNKLGRKKRSRMSWDIQQDMKEPSKHHYPRFPADHPNYSKCNSSYYETMHDFIDNRHILRDL